MAAALSDIRTRFSRGTVPSGRMKPPRWASAISVPVLSNRSTNRKAKTTVTRPTLERAPRDPSAGGPGRSRAARRTRLRTFAGRPAIATTVTARMPMITPPMMRRYSRATISAKPSVAITTGKLVRLPCVTSVAWCRRDDAGVLERDQRQEQADAGGDRHLERLGDGVDDPFADRQHADDEEDDAGDEHAAQRHLPAVAHAAHHAEGEVGVQPHARRQGDRIVGEEGHQEAADGGGHAGRHEHRAERHLGGRQDRRIDEDDVGHRQEGRDPGHDLRPHVGPFSLSLKSRSSIRVLPRVVAWSVRALACAKPVAEPPERGGLPLASPVSYSPPPLPTPQQGPNQNADEPVLSADHEGERRQKRRSSRTG